MCNCCYLLHIGINQPSQNSPDSAGPSHTGCPTDCPWRNLQGHIAAKDPHPPSCPDSLSSPGPIFSLCKRIGKKNQPLCFVQQLEQTNSPHHRTKTTPPHAQLSDAFTCNKLEPRINPVQLCFSTVQPCEAKNRPHHCPNVRSLSCNLELTVCNSIRIYNGRRHLAQLTSS